MHNLWMSVWQIHNLQKFQFDRCIISKRQLKKNSVKPLEILLNQCKYLFCWTFLLLYASINVCNDCHQFFLLFVCSGLITSMYAGMILCLQCKCLSTKLCATISVRSWIKSGNHLNNSYTNCVCIKVQLK